MLFQQLAVDQDLRRAYVEALLLPDWLRTDLPFRYFTQTTVWCCCHSIGNAPQQRRESGSCSFKAMVVVRSRAFGNQAMKQEERPFSRAQVWTPLTLVGGSYSDPCGGMADH